MSLRQFRDWIRIVIVPPDWILWGADERVLLVGRRVDLCGNCERFSLLWLKRAGQRTLFAGNPTNPRCSSAVGSLAIRRLPGVAFHPLRNRRYGVWLAQTPWKFLMPLPLGPISNWFGRTLRRQSQ